ncbi:MAG TPA: ATP-binding cassette domain-containing protein [Egibacteraceae bacterium]|nr:ATP-binding cassette domain-containing protein [Egibacteraceae bacterium]
MPTPALELSGITKRFGPVPAVKGVDLEVPAGEVVALVGENGAGKSTLVRCVARLTQHDGSVRVHGAPLGRTTADVLAQGVGFVWQDLGLCEDLDVVANLFLGRERRKILLDEAAMDGEARALLSQLSVEIPDLRQPAATLSRGQRQMVAIARALVGPVQILVLDEPTASLGVGETRAVFELVRRLRDQGMAILVITHDLDLAFRLATRIAVMREGEIVAQVSPLEVHPEDVVALISGIEIDSMARRQLRRLHSLVDQLSGAEPSASLPLIISAMAAALHQEMLCVHLNTDGPDGQMLRLSAAVGLPEPLLQSSRLLPVGPGGGCVGLAAQTGEVALVEDVRVDPAWDQFRGAAAGTEIRSAWAAPIMGRRGVLGTISGYDTALGAPRADRLELVSLYAGHAASAIERERLLAEVTRRNRILESLRTMLESLAGPDRIEGGLSIALLALCRGLGAEEVAVLRPGDHAGLERVAGTAQSGAAQQAEGSPVSAIRELLAETAGTQARVMSPGVAGAQLQLPDGPAALVAQWADPDAVEADAIELLEDAARSLGLALEREALEQARQEADALRRSQRFQRDLLGRLSHELRTPLTAIHGYASTLQQPDLVWDAESTERFLSAIAAESARMERLVGDLLDSSTIESGLLRLQRHWCDLGLVLDAARACVTDRERVTVGLHDEVDPIWADHDRLEQVFVNLIENGLRHSGPGCAVEVTMRRGAAPQTVEVRVADDGVGIPPSLASRLFSTPSARAQGARGNGLGLIIVRGIVEAHGGAIELAESERGTCFVVTLPTEPPDGTEPDASATDWELIDEARRTVA